MSLDLFPMTLLYSIYYISSYIYILIIHTLTGFEESMVHNKLFTLRCLK